MPLRMGDILKAVRNHDLIITPTLNQHLMQHGDDPLPEDIAQLIYEQLVTKPRDRSRSFSASSAGDCYRAQELGFLGIPQVGAIDPRLANIFNDGKWRHLRWQAMLLHAGLIEAIEVPHWWRRMLSRGTLDGKGTVSDDHPRTAIRGMEFGFELKGTNPFTYAKAVKQEKDIMAKHKRQIARYLLMTGYDLWVTIYENKATNEWFEWVEFPDDEYMDEQRQELQELVDAIQSRKLHDMLPQCKIRQGAFHDCGFGGTPSGPCPKAGDWPNLRAMLNRRK